MAIDRRLARCRVALLILVGSHQAAGFTVPVANFAAGAAALKAYSDALIVNPLETKVATAIALAVAGDALAQGRECAPYDTRRAASFVAFDAIYRGAFQHVTFPLISEAFKGVALHGALPGVPLAVCASVTRTLFNQCVIVPTIYYPLFFAITAVVQGLSTQQGIERAKSLFVPLVSRNLLFWVPVQYCQFAFVDEAWQVPYVCAMGLVWNIILSALAGNAQEDCALELEAEPVLGSVVPTLANPPTATAAEASGGADMATPNAAVADD